MKKLLFAFSFLLINIAKGQSYIDPLPQFKIEVEHFPKISQETLLMAYKAVSEFGIPFKYPQAGCESRAYAMALILDSVGVPNFRIWFFAPALFRQGDNTGFYVYDLNDKEFKIRWTYHTAPVVLLDNKGKVDTMVLDPSLEDKNPLLLSAWFSKMENYKTGQYTYAPDKSYAFNKTDGVFNGYFYDYVDLSYDDMWAEQALALDFVGRFIHGKYINKKGKSYDSDFVDLIKPLINDIDNFKGYVLTDKLPSACTITRRQLYEQYPQFVLDCKNVYNREFIRWSGELKRLRRF